MADTVTLVSQRKMNANRPQCERKKISQLARWPLKFHSSPHESINRSLTDINQRLPDILKI